MREEANKKKIILASSSPRRISLLKNLIPEYHNISVDINEEPRKAELPRNFVKRMSLEKARAAAKSFKNEIIIAADTAVVIDGLILGKPATQKRAGEMLRLLSGKTHKVMTGISVVDSETGKSYSACVVTKVIMAKLTDNEIKWYIKSGEPFDKAGGYGIQGIASLFIERIDGDYFNVVGLPVFTLRKLLEKFGIDLIKIAAEKKQQ
ncbi:MAG: septum formation inhibitor Maf [Candidatus Schekmanbacteria bacterium]|nr:septum formation inhibitor Maf [Candidatus Schekmanbacteria bacterium]